MCSEAVGSTRPKGNHHVVKILSEKAFTNL